MTALLQVPFISQKENGDDGCCQNVALNDGQPHKVIEGTALCHLT